MAEQAAAKEHLAALAAELEGSGEGATAQVVASWVELEAEVQADVLAGDNGVGEYNIVVVTESDARGLEQRIRELGGKVVQDAGTSILIEADLTRAQLLDVQRALLQRVCDAELGGGGDGCRDPLARQQPGELACWALVAW